MVIKGNGTFAEQLPIFHTGILTATTRSDSHHDIYIMDRDDYFNKSEIDFNKAIQSKTGILNSYIEHSCNGNPLVVIVKNKSSEPIELSLILEHVEQKQIFTSTFGGRNPFVNI